MSDQPYLPGHEPPGSRDVDIGEEPAEPAAARDRPAPGALASARAALETIGLWLVGHAPRFLPFVVIAGVIALSWGALRQIHPHQVGAALALLDSSWLALAALATAANIAVMGLYDVL